LVVDALDVVQRVYDACRPLSTHDVVVGLGASRESVLNALLAALKAEYLRPELGDSQDLLRWQVTPAGARMAGSRNAATRVRRAPGE
jgi:hypothetical protein